MPAEQTPFALTPDQIATLAQITANGTANYHLGYQYIVNLHHLGQLNLDAGTLYWFQQAREINANDPNSPANAFIREHTTIGLEKVGRTADLQAISNKIGERVINDLLDGQQMTLDRMWQADIAAATGDFGLPVAGWGGAFYYWDRPLTNDPGSPTIGEFIMGDPAQRAIFIEAMSGAALKGAETFFKSGVSPDGANAFLDAATIGLRNLPLDVAIDIAHRTFERAYDAWARGVVEWADKQWKDVQMTLQRFFGGIFDDFDLMDELLKKFRDSMQIVSPLVLDLDGNGFASTGLLEGTQFDHDANGYAERTGWVQGQDGLLVLDRDGNGRIDSGRELFGSETLLADGSKAANGFEALAELDANRDGRIDAQDAAYANLRVWRDRNGDGLVTQAELSTLADAGVAGIGTAYTNVNIVDRHGNTTKQVGGFTRSDGSTGQTADIWFATDPARSRVWDLLPETPAVAALPDLAGYGNLPSLRQAMLRDASGQLQALVQQFVAAADAPTRRLLIDQILFTWAGVTGVDPGSRGYMPEARQLYVLEAFVGQGYIQGYGYNAGTPNTGWNAGAFLSGTYRELADAVYARLMAQSHLAPVFDAIEYNFDFDTRNFVPNLIAAIDALRGMFESGAAGLDELGQVLSLAGANGADVLTALRAEAGNVGGTFGAWLSTLGSSGQIGDDGNNSLTGTSLSELLIGKGGNDTLDGGLGNDLMMGDEGNDVYLFGRGGGQDSVLDLQGDLDVVRFGAGIAASDLSFERQDYEVVIRVAGSSDTLTLRNWGAGASYRIERFEFDDGTVWDAAQIQSQLANVPRIGGAGDDILSAWAGEDTILRGMDGNDNLWGFTGNDTLDGGTGNDRLVGGGGQDQLTGGEGNDKLFGDADQSPASEHGNDLLDGGVGDDYLRGYGGDDVLIAGDGNDTLQGDEGNDRLEGGGGADLMEGGAGSDTLFGGEGNDQLDGSAGDDTLSGGAGDDAYIVDSVLDSVVEALGEGDDVVFSTVSHTLADNVERLQLEGTAHIAGTGNALGNVIVGNLANNTLDGAAGNDQLYGEGGNDVLIGAGGDDQLVGGRGADSLSGGEDNDSLFGDADELPASAHGNDLMDGGAGNDYLRGYGGDDVLIGGDGDDTLQGDDGSDQLDGGLGIDQMAGGAGNDALLGGEGDDVMQGDATDGSIAVASHGADHLDGGAGNDTLYGDGGADVVLGGAGDDTLSGDNGLAVLDASAHGDDRVDGGIGNDTLHGGGGNDVLLGGAGDDVMYGDDAALPTERQGADTLDGGAGNDQLQGGGGDDVYVFARGYGNDTIFDRDAAAGNADRIRLDGLRPQDVVLEREAGTYNLVVRILETNETLKVTNHFYLSEGGIAEHAVEAIEFADGTVLTAAQIAQATVLQINGTGSDDTISGGSAGEFVRGFDGNDSLSGGPGNDWLDGGAGNDVLYGGDGDASGGGNDVFVWGRGGGQDTIIESLTEADQDVLRLVGLRPHDVTFTAQTADLVIAIEGTADRLRVQGYFSSGARTVETILFADGQTFDRAAVSQRIVSSITGTAGNDTLLGTTLADRIDGGAGNDTLYAYGGNDTLIGGAGNDTLNGDVGDDTYVFARGDGRDTIYDGSSTTNGGIADRVQFAAGIMPVDVIFTARADLPPTDPDYDSVDRVSSDDLIVALRDSGDRILIDGFLGANGRIESFVFADGTVVTSGQVLDALRRTDGTSGDDALRGGVSADTIMGLDGNDTARGFDGHDLVDGGAGNDRLFGDEGNDVLLGGGGDDTLRGGTGDDRLDGGAGYDTVYGEDGNDVLVAGADGAYLEGGAGDDVLDSGAGGVSTRTVEYRGGAGNDTYVLRAGMGRVTITDRDAQAAAIDVVQLADFRSSDVRITQDGNKLSIVSIANPNDVLELYRLWESTDPYNNITAPDRLIDRIRFADGTELTVDQLITASAVGTFAADTLRGTNADDTIEGNAGNDWIYGHLGDDVLRGGDGDDRLFGMHGSDRLEGGAGNDTLDGAGDWTASGDGTNKLIGGAGNDRNIGGLGNDIVVFGRGDGSDTIEDTNGGAADTLQLGSGVLPEHVALYRDGTDLVVVVDGSNTQTRIKSFYSLTNRPIDRIVFDGGAGAVWDIAQMEANAISGTANAMTGTAGDDVFVVDNALDTVTEAANSGIDEVRSSVTFGLPANVENFTATGVLNLTIRGNTLDNVLRGNAGENEFRVSGGYDRGLGGLGNDSYYIERDSMGTVGLVNPEENAEEGIDTIFQVSGDWAYSYYSVTLPQNVERLVLGNSASHWYNSYTGDYDPRGGYGNSGDNEIYGEVAAENYLDGAGGRDVLIGGSAGDVYVVDSDDDTSSVPTSFRGERAVGRHPASVAAGQAVDLSALSRTMSGSGSVGARTGYAAAARAS